MSDELRIVRGVPTDEELAAIVGVLLGRPRPAAPVTRQPLSQWARSTRPTAVSRGADAWRASMLPR